MLTCATIFLKFNTTEGLPCVPVLLCIACHVGVTSTTVGFRSVFLCYICLSGWYLVCCLALLRMMYRV